MTKPVWAPVAPGPAAGAVASLAPIAYETARAPGADRSRVALFAGSERARLPQGMTLEHAIAAARTLQGDSGAALGIVRTNDGALRVVELMQQDRAQTSAAAVNRPEPSPPPKLDEARMRRVLALREKMSTISGGAGSLLPRSELGYDGVRYLNGVMPRQEIAAAVGAELSTVKDPIRVYAGFKHAQTHTERAALAVREAERLGAFDRSTVVLYHGSGTGHVNPVSVQSGELVTHGDIASISVQYGRKPSIQSLHKTGEARDAADALLAETVRAIEQRPVDSRPRFLLMSGESLGAWAQQDVFTHNATLPPTQEIRRRGVTAIFGSGTPGITKARMLSIGERGHRVTADGSAVEFANADELADLVKPGQEGRVAAYYLTNYNDPVTAFRPDAVIRELDWMRDPQIQAALPHPMRYVPLVTGIQLGVDAKNGTNMKLTRGVLGADGHDYRGTVTRTMAKILGKPMDKEQAERMLRVLEQEELIRVANPVDLPY